MKSPTMMTIIGVLALNHGSTLAAAADNPNPAPPVQQSQCDTTAQLVAHPNSCLATSTAHIKASGIVNDYSEIDSLAIYNKSKVPAQGVRGQVFFYNGTTQVGSVPFTAIGIIGPTRWVNFSSASGTLVTTRVASKADSVRIVYQTASGI